MVLALPGEAVAAVEVAAVGDVQAECLDVAGIIFKLSGDVRIDVRCKQFFVIFQLLNLCIALPQVCLADGLAVCLPPYLASSAEMISLSVLSSNIAIMS